MPSQSLRHPVCDFNVTVSCSHVIVICNLPCGFPEYDSMGKLEGKVTSRSCKLLPLLFLPRSSTTENMIPESPCLPAGPSHGLPTAPSQSHPHTPSHSLPGTPASTRLTTHTVLGLWWQPGLPGLLLVSDVVTWHFILLLRHLMTAIPLSVTVLTQGLPWSATSKRKENPIFLASSCSLC